MVQLAESVPTHLAGIPVSTAIPAPEVLAGRECAVLLFDDNPDNAVVVTVHGAVPAFPPTINGNLDVQGKANIGEHGPGIDAAKFLRLGSPNAGIHGKAGLSVEMGTTSAPAAGVNVTGGALTYRGSAGTVTPIAPA